MAIITIQSTGWDTLPDNARIWIYQADRELTDAELDRCIQQLDGFMGQWNTHGTQLAAGYRIEYNQFIMLAVNESHQYASGCSIDSSVKQLRELGRDFEVDFFNRLIIVYKDKSNNIQQQAMIDFEQLLKSGELSPETIVFNNLIQTKGELTTNWETSVENSWHKQLL